jgi:CheY-like chemotaxis protein
VLVAEDDRDLAELVARTLRLAGHEVALAHDGLRALELAVGGPFDALLTDLTMPGLTGEQLARLLCELRPDLPIVLMTASDEPPADGPWSSLVRKPFGLDVLVAAVESALAAGGG